MNENEEYMIKQIKKTKSYKKLKILFYKVRNTFYFGTNCLKIRNYNLDKKQRKKVIYTCISGDYDYLKNFKYFDKDWDYVCYTNQKKLLRLKKYNIWKIYPMEFKELDQVRNARWHKVFPNKLFGYKYEKSLWLDGNVIIKSKSFFEKIESVKDKKFVSAIHPTRNCIYDEAEECKKLKKDNEILINIHIEKLRKKEFPKNNGLYESNIIYRNHNNLNVEKTMLDWWSWISKYSKRDQLSLNYVCWKNNIPYETFNNWSYRNKGNNEIQILDHL